MASNCTVIDSVSDSYSAEFALYKYNMAHWIIWFIAHHLLYSTRLVYNQLYVFYVSTQTC